jgi:crotonobetainyl-CoA:carnitine CoA-transferase CaiB-like acyl-CoA transferase
MRAMGFLRQVAHPELGPLHMVGAPFRMGTPPAGEGPPPPRLGEHTDDVLAEAGYVDEEVDGFRKSEVVF